MRYLMLLYGDESKDATMSDDERQADMAKWWEYDTAIKEAGATSGGEALQPTATATSVRAGENGNPLTTDGPFAETREQLGGYYVLDVESIDEAIKWAQRCPALPSGTVELRPIMEFDQG